MDAHLVDFLRESEGLTRPPESLSPVASRLVDLLDEFVVQLGCIWERPPAKLPADRFVPSGSPSRDKAPAIVQYVADLGFTGDACRLDEAIGQFYALRDWSPMRPNWDDDEGWKEIQELYVFPLKIRASALRSILVEVRQLIIDAAVSGGATPANAALDARRGGEGEGKVSMSKDSLKQFHEAVLNCLDAAGQLFAIRRNPARWKVIDATMRAAGRHLRQPDRFLQREPKELTGNPGDTDRPLQLDDPTLEPLRERLSVFRTAAARAEESKNPACLEEFADARRTWSPTFRYSLRDCTDSAPSAHAGTIGWAGTLLFALGDWPSDDVDQMNLQILYRLLEKLEPWRGELRNLKNEVRAEYAQCFRLERKRDDMVEPLTEAHQAAYDLICTRGPLTGKQIVRRLNLTSESNFTAHYVPELKRHGILNRRGLGYYHPKHYKPAPTL